MWSKIRPFFEKYPAQGKVAQLMLRHGLRVNRGKIFCGEVLMSATSLGRAAGVDRRVVSSAVKTIEENPELANVFSRLWPVCHLREVAPQMGWGAIEIVPTNASKSGILAGISSIIASAGLSIRQVVVDDPEVVENPRAFIITDGPVPGELLAKIKMVEGVQGVVIY
jgi:hypothetical protein